MLDNMLAHQKEIEKLLSENPPNTNWEKQLEYFNAKFTHFQHERLVHLIVTMSVGIAALVCCLASLALLNFLLFILDVILMGLFFAYIVYYRRLENIAQSWYPLLDKLKRKTLDNNKTASV